MSPTNLGDLPSNLPVPNQRVQIKRGAAVGTVVVNNTLPQGTKMTDGAGGNMEINYTPRYECRWLVRANAAWHGVNGGWQRCDYGIGISPADLDGISVPAHATPMYLYDNTTVEWRTWGATFMFRLAAGITYTAYMCFWYSSGYNQRYLCNPGYHRIIGVVLGEGEV
jgi:hypothetical protein